MNFEPQLSRKGVPPPPIPIAIEVLVVDPTLLSSAELERLRSISADPAATAATVPPEPFVVTLKGAFRTLGEVRVAIGAARRCDPDIVGLATDDGSPVAREWWGRSRTVCKAGRRRQGGRSRITRLLTTTCGLHRGGLHRGGLHMGGHPAAVGLGC